MESMGNKIRNKLVLMYTSDFPGWYLAAAPWTLTGIFLRNLTGVMRRNFRVYFKEIDER